MRKLEILLKMSDRAVPTSLATFFSIHKNHPDSHEIRDNWKELLKAKLIAPATNSSEKIILTAKGHSAVMGGVITENTKVFHHNIIKKKDRVLFVLEKTEAPMSTYEIMEKTQLTKESTHTSIAYLKRLDLIERTGSPKNAHYTITIIGKLLNSKNILKKPINSASKRKILIALKVSGGMTKKQIMNYLFDENKSNDRILSNITKILEILINKGVVNKVQDDSNTVIYAIANKERINKERINKEGCGPEVVKQAKHLPHPTLFNMFAGITQNRSKADTA